MSNHSSRKHRLKVPFLKFALTAAWEIITIKKNILVLLLYQQKEHLQVQALEPKFLGLRPT